MSVATPLRALAEQPTVPLVPSRAGAAPGPHRVRVQVPRTGRVVVAEPSDARPLRLTRRGLVALVMATTVLAVALLLAGYASWRPAATTPHVAAGATVRVEPGDTLWSIAGRIAPQRDPRDVIDQLRQLNHLSTPDVAAGQVLRIG